MRKIALRFVTAVLLAIRRRRDGHSIRHICRQRAYRSRCAAMCSCCGPIRDRADKGERDTVSRDGRHDIGVRALARILRFSHRRNGVQFRFHRGQIGALF